MPLTPHIDHRNGSAYILNVVAESVEYQPSNVEACSYPIVTVDPQWRGEGHERQCRLSEVDLVLLTRVM